jgi:centromere protein C
MFYVIEGAVNVKVHDTTLILATGAIFIVPRGRPFLLPRKLFFTQALIVALEEEGKAA